MNARRVAIAAWAFPLLVVGAAIFFKLTGAAGFAGAVRAFGAVLFYNFAPGLTYRALQRPSSSDQVEAVFLVVSNAAVLIALARAKIAHAALVAAAMIVAALAISWVEALRSFYFLDYLYAVLVLALVFATGALLRVAMDGGEAKRLEEALASRVPAATMREIARRPEMLRSETRNMSYLACGIRGFSELTGLYANDPPALAKLVRRVMQSLTEAVLACGGTIDRMAPGKMTAFFNAPLNDPDHAVHACDAALRMTEAIAALNRDLARERGGAPPAAVEIGIGVNTGPGIAADFGIAPRIDYTVAGHAAARAEELKDLSANYGFPIIVGEATRTAAEQRLAFLQIDFAPSDAKGPAAPVFAALGNHQVRSSPKFRALQAFHRNIFEAYGAQDWHRTRELIAQCRALSGASQLLYELYLGRIAHYEANPSDEARNGNFKSAAK